MYQERNSRPTLRSEYMFGTALGWLLIFFVVFGLWGCPRYRVWSQEMEGRAEFARAEQNRKIKIEEAKAENEAATSQAEAKIKIAESEASAELIRAKGAAKSTAIIDSALTERYLRYRWVESLRMGNNEVIYIPTEANLPLLEARERPTK